VILDMGLPKMDGIRVLEKWRREGRKMPVLILTARDRWSEKVQGFDAGADDYVTKPFHMEEVLARLRALLRRAAGHATSELTCGPVILDTRSSRVVVDGNPIRLTSHEYRLLAYLMHHQGRVVSRTELVEHLYDQDFDRDSNTIEVFVGRLRKKLGVDVIESRVWEKGGEGIVGGKTIAEMLRAVAAVDVEKYEQEFEEKCRQYRERTRNIDTLGW
jgi:two-component system OmpR family response regulator